MQELKCVHFTTNSFDGEYADVHRHVAWLLLNFKRIGVTLSRSYRLKVCKDTSEDSRKAYTKSVESPQHHFNVQKSCSQHTVLVRFVPDDDTKNQQKNYYEHSKPNAIQRSVCNAVQNL